MNRFFKAGGPHRFLKQVLAQQLKRAQKLSRFESAIARQNRVGLLNRHTLANLKLSNWPVWAKAQLDPYSASYTPSGLDRLFNNTRHRNWTMLSLPEIGVTSFIDPAGLVMPHANSWSIDFAIKTESGVCLSHTLTPITQILIANQNAVKTKYSASGLQLDHSVSLMGADQASAVLKGAISVKNTLPTPQQISIFLTINPFNQEGVSPIHSIQYLSEKGFIIDHQIGLLFKRNPDNILCLKGTDQPLEAALHQWQMILGCKCPNGVATGAVEFKLNLNPDQTEMIQYDCPAHPQSAMLPLLKKTAPKLYQSFIRTKISDYMFDIVRFDQTDRLEKLTKITLPHSTFNRIYAQSVAHVADFRTDLAIFPSTGVRPLIRDSYETALTLCDLGAIESVRSILRHLFDPTRISQSSIKNDSDLGPIAGILHRYFLITSGLAPFQGAIPQLKRMATGVSRRLHFALNDRQFFNPKAVQPTRYGSSPILDIFWGIFGLKTTSQILQYHYDFESAQHYLTQATHYQHQLLQHINTLFIRTHQSPWLPGSVHSIFDERLCDMLAVVTEMNLLPATHPMIIELVQQIKQSFFVDGMVATHQSAPGISPVLSAKLAQVLAAQGDTTSAWAIWDTLIRTASATSTWPERMHPQSLQGLYGEGHDIVANSAFIRLTHDLFANAIDNGVEIMIADFPEMAIGPNVSFQNWGGPWGHFSLELRFGLSEINIDFKSNLNSETKNIFITLPKSIDHFSAINGVHRLSHNRIKLLPGHHRFQLPLQQSNPAFSTQAHV